MMDRFEADLSALIHNITPPCVTTREEFGCGFTNTTEGCFFVADPGRTLLFNRAEAECQFTYTHIIIH